MKILTTIKTSYLNNKIVKDAFALYSGRSINLVVGLASTLIYGIIFLKTQIAVISLFEMVANLFLSFGFTWSTLTLTRFGKEEIQKHRTINNTSSIRIGIILPILLISISLIIFFKDNILEYIGTNDPTIIIYLIFNLILLVIHEHIIYVCVALEKHFHNVLYFIGDSLSKIIILSIFYFHIYSRVSAELYIKLNVLALILLLIGRILSLRYSDIFPIIIGKWEDYRSQIKYVLPQIYGFAGLYVINWVDLYFIRKYWDYDHLGAYQFLYSIFFKLSSFAIIINTLFFPRVMDWKMNNVDNLIKYLKKAPILLLMATVACFTLFLLFYPHLFSIFFGDKYRNAYSAFNMLILSLPFYFVSFLYIPVLNSYDRVQYIQFVCIFSAACNFLVDFLFIKNYGLIAAGLGTFVAYFSRYILLSLAVGKMFNIKYKLVNAVSCIIFVSVIGYCLIIYK
jgi:O-antigen/teichoic acid export membrane protein